MLCLCLCSSGINILIPMFRVRKTSCGALTLGVLKVASLHHFRPCWHSFSSINPFSFVSAGVSNRKPLDPKSGSRKAGRAARGRFSEGAKGLLYVLQQLFSPCFSAGSAPRTGASVLSKLTCPMHMLLVMPWLRSLRAPPRCWIYLSHSCHLILKLFLIYRPQYT